MNTQIVEEASNWFVDFRVGDIDARRRQEFHAWLRRSPEHIQAYLDIAMTYAEVPVPDTSGAIDVQALIDHARSTADANIVHLEMPSPIVPGSANTSKPSSPRVLAIAASFLLATVALGSWYVAHDTYSTDIGEQRTLTLTDGSTVQLNSRSRIRVRYSDDERRIVLLDGQALFQVAKNARRPFIVRVDDAQVRAVGTQFDVYRKVSGTIVTVVEGKVSVDFTGSAPLVPAAIPEEIEVLLAAGEQLTISLPVPNTKVTATKVSAVPKLVDISTATAWTQQRLVFDNASLSEVVEQFNRYSARPIIIETGAADSFHVSGTYSSTNHESLLRFLRVQPGIHLIESDSEIRITRK